MYDYRVSHILFEHTIQICGLQAVEYEIPLLSFFVCVAGLVFGKSTVSTHIIYIYDISPGAFSFVIKFDMNFDTWHSIVVVYDDDDDKNKTANSKCVKRQTIITKNKEQENKNQIIKYELNT